MTAIRPPGRRPLLALLALAPSLVLVPAAGAAVADEGWQAAFSRTATVRASGVYAGDDLQWTFESFSALEMEPSATALFKVRRGLHSNLMEIQAQSRLVIEESRPGLQPNPDGGEPFFQRSEGAISALGWVDRTYRDLVIEGDVNTEGGPNGSGATSRQGLMARWDKGNNFYWFHVNFVTGDYSIWRSRHLAVQVTLPDSLGSIDDFDSRRPYRLAFDLRGDQLRGRVFAYDDDGGRRLVGDTGWVRDEAPQLEGVAGFLTELARQAPFEPLHGSFANVQVRPLLNFAAAEGPRRSTDAAQLRELNPTTTPDSVIAARQLVRSGDLPGAVARYQETLNRYPEHVQTLQELAWLRATAELDEVRDGEHAVELASKALDVAMRTNSLRHQGEVSVLYPRLYFVKLGYTLAAAYGAAGRIFAPVETFDQTVDDTDSSSGYISAYWALDMARAEHRRRGTPETRRLVEFGELAVETLSVGQPLTGFQLPGSVESRPEPGVRSVSGAR